MSELGTVPGGLMRSAGAELFWSLALAHMVCDRQTGRVVVVFPLLSGALVVDLAPDGTGFDLSAN